MIVDTLKELCALGGASGYEDEVRDYIEKRISPYVNSLETDALGNLIAFKKGAVIPDSRVMLCAHMDEVGIIITDITKEGYLRFDFLGGVDRRVVIGKRVFIGPERVVGVFGLKPIHLSEKSEGIPKTDAMYIDIGVRSKEDAEKLVRLGDDGVFDSNCVEFGDGFLKAKAIDDRLGCAVLIELITGDIPCDCHFVFTVQEELGVRGASVASRRLQPEIALIVEGTTAADLPGVSPEKQICTLGGGVVIPFMDRGTVYNRKLVKILTGLAEDNDIPWQTKRQIAGGTDASAIQRGGAGAVVAGIAAAIRNIHSPSSVIKLTDADLVLKLSRLFLEAVADGSA